jgi:hypothetical protein
LSIWTLRTPSGAVEGEATLHPRERSSARASLYCSYHDDRGKLVLTTTGVNFEDLSNSKHSRSWSYTQIKELKRNGGNEIKIEPFSGDSYELHLEGPAMSDAVYKMIGDRIAASRSR